jgi:hypothetical protein
MSYKKILIEVISFPFVVLGMIFTALANSGQKSSHQNSGFDDDEQQHGAFSEAVHEDDGDDGDDE